MTRPVDPFAVARSIIADPHKRYTVSMLDIIAMCKALVATEETPTPVITTELADAIGQFIKIETVFVEEVRSEVFASDTIFHKRERAFYALKKTFQMEFPDVCHD